MIKSKIHQFPVPLLSIQDGLKCESEGCGHLCASEKRMKSHWLLVHRRPGQEVLDWQPAPLQTFYRGNLLRYFTGRGSPVNEIQQYGAKVKGSASEHQHSSILNDSDTFLFRHYITMTSISIAHDGESETLWQVTVPQLAYRHRFLIHGILACSALHLAYKNPAEQWEYLIKASSHQDIAMPLFRSAIDDVDEDNCHSIMGFSHLLVIYSFALEGRMSACF